MARTFNGSTQYLTASSTLLSSEPIDMVSHFRSTTIATSQCVVSLGDSVAGEYFSLYVRGATAGDPISAIKRMSGVLGASNTSTGYSANVYSVGSVTYISDTSRASFIDGGSKGTDITSVSDPSPDFVSIGVLRVLTNFDYFSGDIAESYILNANMSDSVHAVVTLGYSPIWCMPISNIRGWYPLQNDNNNRMAGGYPDLSPVANPTDAIHPPNVIYPRINGVMTI